MAIYAVARPNAPIAVMVTIGDIDPMTEALKGGEVIKILEITEEQASALKAERPVVESAAPAGFVTEERAKALAAAEADTAVRAFAAEIAKSAGGGNAV